jgi:hypothetical protein
VTGPGGLDAAVTPVTYTNNINAGTATASASYAGNGNYNGSNDSTDFEIATANTTTTVDCPASVPYTGSAQEPCTANVTGPGLNQSLTVTYTNNINAGTATASASYAGNGNYNGSSDSTDFEIANADTTTTVTCPASVTYTGSAHTPCSATVTGPNGLNESVSVTHTNNINAGTATASATYAGTANYKSSTGSKTFDIGRANITVTADAKSKVQGQTDPPLTYQVTGKPANGATVSGSLTRVAGENPGTYAILQGNVTNANNSNYNITYVGANLTITAPYKASFLQPINGGLTPAISGMSAADAATAFSNDDSRFKLGSTVPVKFQLTDASGAPITNAGDIRLFVMQADNKPDPGVAETISTSAATEGNLFRLVDATTGTYMFNLSTKSGYLNPGATTPTAFTSQGTYKLSAVLQSGTSYSVNIQLVK